MNWAGEEDSTKITGYTFNLTNSFVANDVFAAVSRLQQLSKNETAKD